jgi:hypothetical protein
LVSLIKVQSAFEPNRAYVDYVVEYSNLSPFAAFVRKLKEGRRDTFSQSIFRYYGVCRWIKEGMNRGLH